jgi:ribosomal protein S18 acetylase RimI-like enzyme
MSNDNTATLDAPARGRQGGPPDHGVRRATAADVDALARTLASAFRDDPVFGWCIPDPRQRDEVLAPWFRIVVGALVAHEETYCAQDAVGAALWVPPEVPALSEEQGARLGALTSEISGVTPGRTEALGQVMEAGHPPAPHLYLWFAGVRVGDQGQGWGGGLLRSRLAGADEQGVPAYLEATSERNRALYERHGFEVTGELSIGGSPTLWQMWRQPRC